MTAHLIKIGSYIVDSLRQILGAKNLKLLECDLPTEYGKFKLIAKSGDDPRKGCIALVMGDVSDGRPVLTRLHSECITGDAFASLRCDCGPQLKSSMASISKEGRGIIIYLRQEGRGIGLINKIRAYKLQELGADTVEANNLLGFADDLRDYKDATNMLSSLNIASILLMTNNPKKVSAIESAGIKVIERISLQAGLNSFNENYLQTKKTKMGHLI